MKCRASADVLFLKRYGIEYLPLAFLGIMRGLSPVVRESHQREKAKS